ncbi:selenium-binding family protein [Tautonia plasticadhaerens]|uniref:selenium-binding family protein n=1 Tax=Tautonia plasticadhaerens TaxID=2527974 RepID=UPI001E308F52|nr:selenium-binding family protein [Tautonia plasticadhaerens]
MPRFRTPALLGLALAILAAPAATRAETCLSPYVKRLDRPEKYLYVFCVDADAQENDFVITVDVDRASPSFGTIIHRLDLGSKGNETHHWGFTDDRTRIWAGGLFSSRIWILDVATDPAAPRVERVLDGVSAETGLSGPHTYYALPGRMLISFLGAADGGLPAALAEFTNDGEFIRRIDQPEEAPYGYDVAVKPELNRMVSSSFTPKRNYGKPFAEMSLDDFGDELVVWDFKSRTPLQVIEAGLAPLEVRWSLKPENDYGFTNCALDHSIYLFKGKGDGSYEAKKVADTAALPADLRQSPDDRYLYVSCFGGDEIQQWDVSDPERPVLASTVVPCVQPNMMHVTSDGKRMYVTNSLLSTLDRSGNFCVRLVHVGPDGMKVDPFFDVDLTGFETGPARGHDMLLN